MLVKYDLDGSFFVWAASRGFSEIATMIHIIINVHGGGHIAKVPAGFPRYTESMDATRSVHA
jgi:hypothetical protein